MVLTGLVGDPIDLGRGVPDVGGVGDLEEGLDEDDHLHARELVELGEHLEDVCGIHLLLYLGIVRSL